MLSKIPISKYQIPKLEFGIFIFEFLNYYLGLTNLSLTQQKISFIIYPSAQTVYHAEPDPPRDQRPPHHYILRHIKIVPIVQWIEHLRPKE